MKHGISIVMNYQSGENHKKSVMDSGYAYVNNDSDFERSNISFKENKPDGVDLKKEGKIPQVFGRLLWLFQLNQGMSSFMNYECFNEIIICQVSWVFFTAAVKPRNVKFNELWLFHETTNCQTWWITSVSMKPWNVKVYELWLLQWNHDFKVSCFFFDCLNKTMKWENSWVKAVSMKL